MLGIGRAGPLGLFGSESEGTGATGAPRASSRGPGPGDDHPAGGLDARARHVGARGGTATDERDAWVVLAGVHGVGPVSFERLLRSFGSIGAVLDRARGRGAETSLVAASFGPDGGPAALSPESARAIVAAARDPERHLAPVRRSGVGVITLADEAYPRRLRRIDLPPPVLFVRGDSDALDRDRAVAIVGTRRPTESGRALAGQIADAVAGLGATVVSGLALGVDAAAHVATLGAHRPTIAVIGGGHLRLYPAAHRGLAASIATQGGAVVSEFAPDVVPTRGTFPRRNRIISGLADATVVVEAGARSGALTTAAWALEQGRGLHIVPGRVGDPAVAGCLAFLREASPEARIVAGVAELLEDLGLLDDGRGRGGAGARRLGTQLALDALLATLGTAERDLARAIVAGSASVDELVAATGHPGATVLGCLTGLEVRGLVIEAFGRYRPAGPLAVAGARDRPDPVVPRPPGRAA